MHQVCTWSLQDQSAVRPAAHAWVGRGQGGEPFTPSVWVGQSPVHQGPQKGFDQRRYCRTKATFPELNGGEG